MNDAKYHDLDPMEADCLADTHSLPGVIAALGELKPGSIVTEEGVAGLFNRHVASVKRAVQRRELPPPCRLFGTNVWTAGVLVRYIETRLEQGAKDVEREARRLANLSTLPHHSRRP